jgi:moderate conductance mechanosensitive channel
MSRSAGWSQAILDLGTPYNEDLNLAKEALTEAGKELLADEEVGQFVTHRPEILGVEDLGQSQVTLRVVARTMAGRQRAVERAFRQCVKEAFERHGIQKGTH